LGNLYTLSQEGINKFSFSQHFVDTLSGIYGGSCHARVYQFNGCAATTNTQVVSTNAGPTSIAINDMPENMCHTSRITLSGVANNIGSAPLYQWKHNNIIKSNSYSYIDTFFADGDVISFEATNSINGCSIKDSVKLDLKFIPLSKATLTTSSSCIPAKLTINMDADVRSGTQWMRNGNSVHYIATTTDRIHKPAIDMVTDEIEFDSAGNMYILDRGNYTIKRFAPDDTSGAVVAGGNGQGTALNQFMFNNAVARGMAVDRVGNIYVVDDKRIMKWAPGASSGAVLIAFNPASPASNFDAYHDVCVDRQGKIYAIRRDTNGYRVQEIAANGTGFQYITPNIPPSSTPVNGHLSSALVNMQLQVYNKEIYILDGGYNGVIKRAMHSESDFAVVGPWAMNGMGQVHGFQVGRTGIYISDMGSANGGRIIRFGFSNAGVLTAGGNDYNLMPASYQVSPGRFGFGHDGTLYVADLSNGGKLVKYEQRSSRQFMATVPGDYFAYMGDGNDCAFRTDTITISSAAAPSVTIRASQETVCAGSSIPVTFTADTSEPGLSLQWVKNGQNVAGNANVYSTGTISNGDTISCIASNGTCYQTSNLIVMRVKPAPVVSLSQGCNGTSMVLHANRVLPQIVWSLNGNVIDTTHNWNDSAQTVAGVTGEMTNNATTVSSPSGIYVTDDNIMYISGPGGIRRWKTGDSTGMYVGWSHPSYSWSINDIWLDDNNYIYYTSGNQANRMFNNWPLVAIYPITKGQGTSLGFLSNPRGITTNYLHSIYISDSANSRVVKWGVNDTIGTLVAGGNGYGLAPGQLASPAGVSLHPDGSTLVAQASGLRKWKPGAPSGSELNHMGGFRQHFINRRGFVFAVGPGNDVTLFAPGDTNGKRVAGSGIGGDAQDQLNQPEDVFVDKDGGIYVADAANHRVEYFSHNPVKPYPITQTGQYITIATDYYGCQVTDTITISNFTPVVGIAWTGQGGDNMWNNGLNWSCNTVPVVTDSVTIPAGISVVVNTPNATCDDLKIEAGGTLSFTGAGAKLQVLGNFENLGTVNTAGGTLQVDAP
jgi:sugar lactone lactonase YvrE